MKVFSQSGSDVFRMIKIAFHEVEAGWRCFCWQAKAGQWKECEASLQRLRGKDANISEEAAEIKVNSWISISESIVLSFIFCFVAIFIWLVR